MVSRKNKIPFRVERIAIDSQNVKLSPPQKRRIQFRAIGQWNDAPIACIYLRFAGPARIFSIVYD